MSRDRSPSPDSRDGEDFEQRAARRDEEYSVPDAVKTFVLSLDRRIRSRAVYEIQGLYHDDYSDISERFFKASPWPAASSIAPLVNEDATFLALYKELYFRHIYNKLQPTVQNRIDSFQNYCELFALILAMRSDEPDLDLPAQWLWDMVDEFIYQFQSFHIFRTTVTELEPEDVDALKKNENAWNAPTVLRLLHSLVKKSQLDAPAKPAETEEPDSPSSDKDDDDDDDNKSVEDEKESDAVGGLFKTLGYFCLIGLLRVNCELGDYNAALRSLQPIDLRQQKALFTQVSTCHATMYYYMGFAYMMLRRYVDAVKVFSSFLVYVNRNKQTRKYQQAQVQKKIERIYGLLSIAVTFTNQRLDENIHTVLREKHADRMLRLQKGEIPAFQEAFLQSCPKFVTMTPPNYEEDINTNADQQNLQMKMFLQEMTQRQKLPDIYSYLKLCTAVSINKLSTFLGSDEDTCITSLLCLKHKTRNLRWRGGPPLSGDWVSAAEVDFHVAKDMVHVAEYKAPRRYGQLFIRQILKFEDTLDYLNQSASNRNK